MNALTFHTIGASVVLHRCVCLPSLRLGNDIVATGVLCTQSHLHLRLLLTFEFMSGTQKCHTRIALECSFKIVWMKTAASSIIFRFMPPCVPSSQVKQSQQQDMGQTEHCIIVCIASSLYNVSIMLQYKQMFISTNKTHVVVMW